MVGVLFNLALVFVLGCVVALDAHLLNAAEVRVSTTPPLLWAIVVWAVAIVGLPLYLYTRTKALEERGMSVFYVNLGTASTGPVAAHRFSTLPPPPAPPRPDQVAPNESLCICGTPYRVGTSFCAACGRPRP